MGYIAMPLSHDPEARARQLGNLRNAPAPEPGNRRAMTHGGKASARLLPVKGKSRAIYAMLAEDAPLRENDGLPAADRTLVELLALCLARLESLAAWLEAHGWLDPKTGNPRPAVDLERHLRVEARGHAEALGLSPRSRVALGLDLMRAAETLDGYIETTYGTENGGTA
jgi:hypothetical protein